MGRGVVTAADSPSHLGSPERLASQHVVRIEHIPRVRIGYHHLMDVTSHPLATACLQILMPRKPFTPQTTSFFSFVWLISPPYTPHRGGGGGRRGPGAGAGAGGPGGGRGGGAG